jgi:hypothetical protein
LPQGTPIEVEFEYAANARISVTARIPSSRQSAHVEIRRQHAGRNEDLETWKRRLLLGENAVPSDPGSPPAQSVGDAANTENSAQRLQALYVKVGRTAATNAVPAFLAAQQEQTAIDAQIVLNAGTGRTFATVLRNPRSLVVRRRDKLRKSCRQFRNEA